MTLSARSAMKPPSVSAAGSVLMRASPIPMSGSAMRINVGWLTQKDSLAAQATNLGRQLNAGQQL